MNRMNVILRRSASMPPGINSGADVGHIVVLISHKLLVRLPVST